MTSFPDGSSPATSNVRGAEYPRVHPDLRVTFRLLAPNAQQVQVQPGGNDNGLGAGPSDMVRGEDGSWTVTTPPAVPGFHYYSLLVDGAAVNDPASDTYFGYDKQISDAFEVLMTNEIVPMVDATYRTIPDREHRGIAGLSMGSFEALRIGLGHLDLFASIAALSGGPFGGFDLQTAYNGVFRDPAAFNEKVRLLWLGAGTAEVWIHTLIVGMHEALQGAGVRHVFYESAGTAHEWQTWRRHLHDLAPRLFRG